LRRRPAPRRADAVGRGDLPGLAGARARPLRAARRVVHRRGQPRVHHARRGLRHAGRVHIGHCGGDAGEPGQPGRSDGWRGHPRTGSGRADPGPTRGEPGRTRRGPHHADRLTVTSVDKVLSDPAEILVGMDEGYRIFVEAWDPSYGTPMDADSGPTGESTAQLVLDVELPAGAWTPLTAPPQTRAPSVVLLVDGVLRTDAWLWI